MAPMFVYHVSSFRRGPGSSGTQILVPDAWLFSSVLVTSGVVCLNVGTVVVKKAMVFGRVMNCET